MEAAKRLPAGVFSIIQLSNSRASGRMQKTTPLISVSGVTLWVGVGFDAYVCIIIWLQKYIK